MEASHHGKRRTALPPSDAKLPPVNILNLLRNAGLDPVLMPLPIQLHEPLTHHMKIAEELEYTELFDKVGLGVGVMVEGSGLRVRVCVHGH